MGMLLCDLHKRMGHRMMAVYIQLPESTKKKVPYSTFRGAVCTNEYIYWTEHANQLAPGL